MVISTFPASLAKTNTIKHLNVSWRTTMVSTGLQFRKKTLPVFRKNLDFVSRGRRTKIPSPKLRTQQSRGWQKEAETEIQGGRERGREEKNRGRTRQTDTLRTHAWVHIWTHTRTHICTYTHTHTHTQTHTETTGDKRETNKEAGERYKNHHLQIFAHKTFFQVLAQLLNYFFH